MTDVQHSGGPAKLAGAPNGQYAVTVDLVEVDVVKQAPIGAYAFEPLKLHESPDSPTSIQIFAKLARANQAARLLQRGMAQQSDRRGDKDANFVRARLEAGWLAVKAHDFGALDATRRRARDLDAVAAELLGDVQYPFGTRQ